MTNDDPGYLAINEVMAQNDPDVMRNWALGFLGLAFANLLAHWFRGSFVFLAGERLTYRLRQDLFLNILSQPAGWFDDKEHSKSSLNTTLGVHTSKARDLVGDSTSILTLIIVMLGGGISVAFAFCWRTAAVVLATMPLMALGGIMLQKIAFASGEDDAVHCTCGRAGQVIKISPLLCSHAFFLRLFPPL